VVGVVALEAEMAGFSSAGPRAGCRWAGACRVQSVTISPSTHTPTCAPVAANRHREPFEIIRHDATRLDPAIDCAGPVVSRFSSGRFCS